ncbi:cap64-like protein [Tulasnella sp. 418]|nr:cap64-like protein [Tulasnella sp. 418]
MGSGVRIQKVIHRALSGLPITVSVLGGSVSACHGAGDDPISPNCYPSRFFEWWNTVFPHPASELTNGAMRKTDSAYFSFCHGHHLPDQTDLVILEFDADDPNDPEWLNHFDLLVRSILQRPDQPAILILGHFAPQMHEAYGSNDPSHLHSLVARFYDVPMLSTRGVIFNDYMSNPAAKKKTYWIDPILANGAGHALLADVMISYFQEMICKGWDAALGRGFDVPVLSTAAMNAPGAGGLFGGAGIRKGAPGEAVANENEAAAKAGLTDPSMQAWSMLRVPPIRINDREPAPGRYMREPVPFCASANDLINPLPPSLFYGSGWHARNPGTSRSDAAGSLNYYWYSTIPMSKLRVPVKLHAGDVAIYYLLEPEKNFPKGGAGVLCWVDDNVAGAVEISGVADINSPVPALMIIDRSVDPGSHYVECQLMGEEGESSPAFKILGIFAT